MTILNKRNLRWFFEMCDKGTEDLLAIVSGEYQGIIVDYWQFNFVFNITA